MICWFESHSNNVQFNTTHVFLISSITNDKHGLLISQTNFRMGLALHTARKLITSTWKSNPDEYLAPKDKDNDK